MPTYRENPLIIPFSMLCPGISRNMKHHYLTLYKGQVWEEKSYLEICNHNVLDIVYDPHFSDIMELNRELYVSPVPGYRFKRDWTQIPWDGEILQSFAQLTNIKHITFDYWGLTYQINVASFYCQAVYSYGYECVPPASYYPRYIWTKEGFKIQIKSFRLKI